MSSILQFFRPSFRSGCNLSDVSHGWWDYKPYWVWAKTNNEFWSCTSSCRSCSILYALRSALIGATITPSVYSSMHWYIQDPHLEEEGRYRRNWVRRTVPQLARIQVRLRPLYLQTIWGLPQGRTHCRKNCPGKLYEHQLCNCPFTQINKALELVNNAYNTFFREKKPNLAHLLDEA